MSKFLETLRLLVWRSWYAVLYRLPGMSSTTATLEVKLGRGEASTLILTNGGKVFGIVVLDTVTRDGDGTSAYFTDLARHMERRTVERIDYFRDMTFNELLVEAERRRPRG